jgi:hypothetical protein
MLVGYWRYSEIMRAELEKRLQAALYLTCEEFALFDVNCCDLCHNCYPHYDMYAVEMADGRMAWVCCPVRHVLMRTLPDRESKLDEILRPNGRPDKATQLYRENEPDVPVYDLDMPSSKKRQDGCDREYLDALVQANKLADSDEAKLSC